MKIIVVRDKILIRRIYLEVYVVELRDAILKRRSIRRFKSKEIPKDVLETIAKFSLLAPSGRNSKPVKLYIVTNKEIIKKIEQSRPGAFAFLETAPALFVVSADKESGTWICDASIVATYIQLLAVDFGLGSCWGHAYDRVYEGKRVDERIKEILGIPANENILCVIGIGYPDEEKKEHSLNELDNKKIILFD